MTDWVVPRIHHEHVMAVSLELFHSGMDFTESWWPMRAEQIQDLLFEDSRNVFLYLSRNHSIGEIVDGIVPDLTFSSFTNKGQVCSVVP